MNKKIFSVILVFFIFLFKVDLILAKEPAHILFINQARGEECCQKGSLSNLKMQVEAFNKYQIPAYFALRYDVLKDEKYLNLIKDAISSENIRLGLLLEITPQLANDSGVKYRGNKNNWFEAQNIFSIGYSIEDNKKIVDHLFSTFKDIFGYYPKITSSWMITTETLNYMSEKYGVLVHQITKEQYSTDSYTLYGGSPHYPYPANSNWLMIPDYERTNAPLIVRQTITDPLYNYGDDSASFTSQPNDYMRDSKDFNYFKKLINQAIDQPGLAGFGLLGLENSMDKVYQKEYLSQIEYVKKLQDKKIVKFPQLNELLDYWRIKKVTVYGGKDLIRNSGDLAYWINTPNYRLRLRLENNHLSITDLRIYSKEYLDPYSTKVAQKEGFWIVPYLIDASRESGNLKNDVKYNISRLEISSYKKDTLKWVNNKDSLGLQYQDSFGKNRLINFNLDKIIINSADKNQIKYFDFLRKDQPIKYQKNMNGMKLIWKIGGKISHGLRLKFDKNKTVINFEVNPKLIETIRKKQYPYLFPEPVVREISTEKSKVIVHNRFAIANRNPVRLVVIPYDTYGVPSVARNVINVETKPVLSISKSFENKLNFVDISSKEPEKALVIIKIANKQIKKENIYFAPNCTKDFSVCIKNPQYFWWYINTVIGDKIRLIFSREQQ